MSATIGIMLASAPFSSLMTKGIGACGGVWLRPVPRAAAARADAPASWLEGLLR